MRERLAALRESGAGRPLLAPHEDSRSQDLLDAVAQVGEADVADVDPTTHAVPLPHVLREDVATPSLPRDVVLAAAPAAEDDRFRVPRILGED